MAPNFKAITASLLALAAGVVAILTTFKIVHWSAAQTTLVSTAVAALISFVMALIAHFWPATKKEPVALAATFTAGVSAILALGTGFDWWHFTADQTAAVVSLVTALIGIGTAVVARNSVVAGQTGNPQVLTAAITAANEAAA